MQHYFLLYDGQVVEESQNVFSLQNFIQSQGFLVIKQFGRIHQSKFLFQDEIYFNLMASMRKLRMKIPLEFTPDYFPFLIKSQISPILNYTYTLWVWEQQSVIHTVIEIKKAIDLEALEAMKIEVYKEFYILADYLNALHWDSPKNKVTQRYISENQIDEVILLNSEKSVARSLRGNFYYYKNKQWYSNNEQEGAYRQAIDKILEKTIEVERKPFSAFELQNADAVCILSDQGLAQNVRQFRKKTYTDLLAHQLNELLI